MADEFALPGIVNTEDLDALKKRLTDLQTDLGPGWIAASGGQNQPVQVTATPQAEVRGPAPAGAMPGTLGDILNPAMPTSGWAQFMPPTGPPASNFADPATSQRAFYPYTQRQPTMAQEDKYMPWIEAGRQDRATKLADLNQLERMLTAKLTVAPPSDLMGQFLYSKMQSDSITQLGQIEQLRQYMTSGGLPPKASTASPDAQAFSTLVDQNQKAGLSSSNSILKAYDQMNEIKTGVAVSRTTATTAAGLPGKLALKQAPRFVPMTDREMQPFVESYLAGKPFEALGLGAEMRLPLFKRVAQVMEQQNVTGGDLALRAVQYKTMTAEIAKLRTMYAAVAPFAETAHRNLLMVREISDAISRSDVPVVNKFMIPYGVQVQGNADMAGFQAATRVAVNEVARVLQRGASMGGVLSDSARKEVEDLLSTANTPEQVNRMADVLERDMKNMIDSYADTILSAEQSLRNISKQPGIVTPAGQEKQEVRYDKQGKAWILRGGKAVPFEGKP